MTLLEYPYIHAFWFSCVFYIHAMRRCHANSCYRRFLLCPFNAYIAIKQTSVMLIDNIAKAELFALK